MTVLGRAVLCVMALRHFGTAYGQGDSRKSCNTPGNERRTCLNIKKCPVLVYFLRRGSQCTDVKSYLRRSVCGYDGKYPMVCCPEREINKGEGNVTLPAYIIRYPDECEKLGYDLKKIVEGSDADLATEQNRTVSSGGYLTSHVGGGLTFPTNVSITTVTLPKEVECGKIGAEIPKVVAGGGMDAELGLFPWMTLLGYTNGTLSGLLWLCAGSLITERHVITAGHCVVGTPYMLVVARLGELDVDETVVDHATPTDYEVDSWIAHPGYKTTELVNDIAIVAVKNKVTFTSLIQPICLPTLKEFSTKDFTGYAPYVAGWGAKVYQGPVATRLQRIQIEVKDHYECQKTYSSIREAVIDKRVICAGLDGRFACQGDSGAPLMLPRRTSFYLFGIVSYGQECAKVGYPGIYTRVSEFMKWILSSLK